MLALYPWFVAMLCVCLCQLRLKCPVALYTPLLCLNNTPFFISRCIIFFSPSTSTQQIRHMYAWFNLTICPGLSAAMLCRAHIKSFSLAFRPNSGPSWCITCVYVLCNALVVVISLVFVMFVGLCMYLCNLVVAQNKKNASPLRVGHFHATNSLPNC